MAHWQFEALRGKLRSLLINMIEIKNKTTFSFLFWHGQAIKVK
jgi:hypothetical protein